MGDDEPRLGHGLGLATVVLVAAGVVLAPWQALDPDPGDTLSWLGQLLGALTFGYVGAVIAGRTQPPTTRVGTVLQVTGLTQAATLATSSYLHRASVEGWPAVGAVQWLDGWLWTPGVVVVLAVFPLLYPSGAALPGFRRLVQAGVTLTVLSTAVVAVEALPRTRSHPPLVDAALVASIGACAAVGVASLVLRYRRGDARTRAQVRWLAAAVAVMVAFEPLQATLPRPAAVAGLALLPLLLPAAVGLAVLRHGLYDIDLLLTRTLTYVLLCTLLAGMYVVVVLAAEQRLGGAALQWPALVAAVTVALCANPCRIWLQGALRRRLWGASAEPHRLLADLARRLGSSPSLREAPQAVVDTVAAAFRAPYAELLAVAEDGATTVVARAGTGLAGAVAHTPVRYGGRQVGLLTTARDDDPEPREVRALEQVAAALGPVLDGWLLTAELQQARERTVSAREAERSRLHRDLHDGLGPTLGGITLGVHAAHNLMGRDPAAAESVLTRLSELAGQATAEVRALVDGLRPAALDTHGLVGALRQTVDVGAAGPAVDIHAAGVDRLPPAVEVAALRIAQEAVTNVRRHARATRCDIRLTMDPEQMLTVLVEDDGVGLAADRPRTGVGLESISARAAELGGVATVGPSPLGGTRVLARIPVGGPDD